MLLSINHSRPAQGSRPDLDSHNEGLNNFHGHNLRFALGHPVVIQSSTDIGSVLLDVDVEHAYMSVFTII